MMGCGFQMGEQGYNVGRNAALLAGLDHHVPATTVNRFCASSLQTIRMAFHAIKAGEGDQYIAAGVEAVSRSRAQAPSSSHPQLDGSESSLFNVYIPMGMTAENVAERCNVCREAQDEWAVTSQHRAVAARDAGHFDAEIVAGDDARGQRHARRRPAAGHDDGEARRAQAGLQPEGGTVTAGNACPLNDGAAAVLVMSEEQARGARPQAPGADRRLRRGRASGRRSWASARSPPSRPCSSRPA